ncbi:MAG: hypothetical protein H6626_08200 [Pseudobdellovibrionaceae bacterium]|nr:hypothetical protein [Bdellovibrionales bacterium]USN46205.1 MAG: hypothetical protein H6626_08200 [Pseudobdellovibrionaceae bacterium]
MKTVTKIFTFFVAIFLILPAQAQEIELSNGASVCLEDVSNMGLSSRDAARFSEDLAYYEFVPGSLYLIPVKIRCENYEALGGGLEAISITFETAAVLSLACTGGVGVQAAVTFGTIGVVLRVAKFAVSNIPCDSDENYRVEQQIKSTLCELAGRTGNTCDIKKIKINYKDDGPYTPIPKAI